MSLTLIATPGATNANTYSTKAEASAVGGYFETRLFKATWTAASTANKNTALVWATRLLDEWVDWYGSIVDDDQALRWPRYGVETPDGYDVDFETIPQFLKDATAELAVHLLAGDPTAAPDTQGFSRLKVGSLELDIDKTDRDGETVIPDSVKAIVERYGTIRRRGSGGTAQLMRA